MQVAVNTEYVSKRRQLYRRTIAMQFVLWVGALVVWFAYPQLMPATWPLLVIVFLVSNLARQIQFEAGTPMPTEQRLERALKPLSNRYWLGSYLPINNKQVVNHMLIGPEGVLVIEPRNHNGLTTYSGGRWRRRTKLLQRMLGIEPGIGDPTREVTGLVELVRNDLSAAGLGDVPVSGAVVFTSRNASLELEDCPVTALTIQQLTQWASKHKLTGDNLIPEPLRHKVIGHYMARLPQEQPREAQLTHTSSS